MMNPGKSLLMALPLLALTVATTTAAPLVTTLPGPKDKCPVCGMLVANYPDWVVTVTFRDSTVVYFDGAKDFFTYFQNTMKYTPNRHFTFIASIAIKDYYHLKQIDARTAYYVTGSDVYGPMGKELIPFEHQNDALIFFKDHSGKKVLRFKDITPAVLKSLE